MRRLLLLAGCFMLVAAFTLPGRLPAGPATPAESSNSEVNVMSTEFAVDLYHKLGKGGGNVFFSPWSIDLALTMTWAGARGATADEMAKVLHLPGDPDVVAREFLGPGYRHGGDAGLGGGIVGLPDIAVARNAGNVDDHAAAAVFDHLHGGLASAQEHASEINRDHPRKSMSDIFLSTLPSAAFTNRASLVMPALLMRPSALPKSLRTLLNSASTAGSSVTSAG